MCGMLYARAEDIVKITYNEHSRSTNEQKDVDVKRNKAHTTHAKRDKEGLRAGKMHKKQENGKNVTKQTREGKYSTLSGKTILYKLR